MTDKFAPNADTLNAITSAMGALAMCITRNLEPAQRQAIASDIARLAAAAEKSGDTTLETLLIDMHRAVS